MAYLLRFSDSRQHLALCWQDKVFRTEIMQSSRAVGAAAFSGFQPELEAADIELEESVRAVWSIL